MGKFGANSKLTNVVTIEPDDEELVLAPNGTKLSQLSYDLNRLAESCIPNELKETSNDKFKSIVKTTSDFLIKVEEVYRFNVHKVRNKFN